MYAFNYLQLHQRVLKIVVEKFLIRLQILHHTTDIEWE